MAITSNGGKVDPTRTRIQEPLSPDLNRSSPDPSSVNTPPPEAQRLPLEEFNRRLKKLTRGLVPLRYYYAVGTQNYDPKTGGFKNPHARTYRRIGGKWVRAGTHNSNAKGHKPGAYWEEGKSMVIGEKKFLASAPRTGTVDYAILKAVEGTGVFRGAAFIVRDQTYDGKFGSKSCNANGECAYRTRYIIWGKPYRSKKAPVVAKRNLKAI